MQKKVKSISMVKRSWRLSLLAGVLAAITGLMFGLLLQTVFYEIASGIPSVIRQDYHISLPLCNVFPDLYGCDAWVGKYTALEIWKRSLVVGQIGGLILDLVFMVLLSIWLTVQGRSDSLVPGLLTGVAGGFSTLLLALAFNVPLTLRTLPGSLGILLVLLLPLGGVAGGRFGRERLSRKDHRQMLYFYPGEANTKLDGIGETLSKRELEVLALVASGFRNHEIARRLYISKATVKTHLLHIYGKLDVKNRTAAVTKALACGLLLEEAELGSKGNVEG